MRVSVAVVAAVLTLTACGSSGGGSPETRTVTVTATATVTDTATGGASVTEQSSAPASSASVVGALPDACSLLTKREAEALAHTPLNDPVPSGPLGTGIHNLCQFGGPTTGPTAQVEVFVGDGAKKSLDIDRINLKHRFVRVPGIGDECLLEDGNVFVHKNGLWAQINLVLIEPPAKGRHRLQRAARAMADRMP
jgi:hypothetical protein